MDWTAADKLLVEHERKAKEDPKLYYRDGHAEWGHACEFKALEREAAARAARMANDEQTAQMHDVRANRWRVLIRN